jgi:hypothetical protein
MNLYFLIFHHEKIHAGILLDQRQSYNMSSAELEPKEFRIKYKFLWIDLENGASH